MDVFVYTWWLNFHNKHSLLTKKLNIDLSKILMENVFFRLRIKYIHYIFNMGEVKLQS